MPGFRRKLPDAVPVIDSPHIYLVKHALKAHGIKSFMKGGVVWLSNHPDTLKQIEQLGRHPKIGITAGVNHLETIDRFLAHLVLPGFSARAVEHKQRGGNIRIAYRPPGGITRIRVEFKPLFPKLI